MTRYPKILITSGFLLVLLALGTTDALLTRSTLWLPSKDAEVREGVAKRGEPDVEAVARTKEFTVTQGTDAFLMQQVLPAGQELAARVLLKDDDRAAAIAWIDSPHVKNIFTRLKAKLRFTFSGELRDLIDETQTQPGKPPRDVLSFLDPAIHENRILVVRIRERLYEFHVVGGHEGEVDGLIDALTD